MTVERLGRGGFVSINLNLPKFTVNTRNVSILFKEKSERMYVNLLSIPQPGGKMSKRLVGIMGCKYKTSLWHFSRIPDGIIVTLGQQYDTGEKPNVIRYTNINRHAGTRDKKQNINVILI